MLWPFKVICSCEGTDTAEVQAKEEVLEDTIHVHGLTPGPILVSGPHLHPLGLCLDLQGYPSSLPLRSLQKRWKCNC
ncbi:hypothetical protein Ancab_003791 [Ancistrocladus abbreviatus]